MVAVGLAVCVLQHAVRLVDHEELQVLQTDLKQKSFIFEKLTQKYEDSIKKY